MFYFSATEEFLFKTFSTLGPIASQISDGKPKIRIIRGVNTDACVIRYVEDSVAEAVIKEFNGNHTYARGPNWIPW